MPSFDIASKVDVQVLDNTINTVKKEIATRYDFRGSHVTIELNKKDMTVQLEVESDLQLKQLEDMLITRAMRQGLESNAFDFSKEFTPSGKLLKKTVTVKNGIDKDNAKKIVKLIKDAGSKVQPAIMDDIIRVTGKKIDDLQAVIALLRGAGLDLPLQFTNMKS